MKKIGRTWWALAALALVLHGAQAQQPAAAAAATAEQKEAELELRQQELDRLQQDLSLRQAELKTAEERQSNLQLEQAVLDARKSLVQWRRAVERFTLNTRLAERGIVSPREVDTSRETAENAELAYQDSLLSLEKARLSIISDAAVVSVVGARVYRVEGARKAVDITLANLSNLGKARVAHHELPDSELGAMLLIPDIRVMLRDGAIIAEPYVQDVDTLELNEEHTLTFRLLQNDVESLTVDLTYMGKSESERVFLRKDSENDLPEVSAANFDQTGQLGETIAYELMLERLAETEKTYQLATLNLPSELKVHFREKQNNAQISAVKFAREMTKKSVELQVIIPSEMPREKLDVPVTFYVLAIDEEARERLLELKRSRSDADISVADLTAAGIGFERLVFTPRGVGEVELVSQDLYNEITAGDSLQVRFKVKNTGSVPLANIRMDVEVPPDWEVHVEPQVVRSLDMAEEVTVLLELYPAPDLGIGDYTVRVDATGRYEGQDINIDDKIVRIHVQSRANVVGGVILLLVLVGALVGIAIFLVRLARR